MFASLEILKNMFLPNFSFPKFGLNSVLDILVISYVIYKILMWIKQTRGWILFKGVIIILTVSGLSYIFELKTVSWIIANAYSAGIMAIVILFQPELRKALEKVGKGSVANLFPDTENDGDKISEKTVDAIITAAVKMAKVRTGALMVVEHEVPLGDLASTGIPIDAVVSSQLLINIFENKTPLHDGAVIIRNNRVAAASCILPLTQNALSSELGTRHRAGVGASEVSDAYIVIVSEESGNISIAKEGKLMRNVSADEIYEVLTHNRRTAKRKTAIRKERRAR